MNFSQPLNTVIRKAVTVEKHVALTVWFLATGADYRTIGHLFGISKSIICVVTKEVCAAMVDRLLLEYIKMPTGTALTMVVEDSNMTMVFRSVLEL